jgi:hypothetical protein
VFDNFGYFTKVLLQGAIPTVELTVLGILL